MVPSGQLPPHRLMLTVVNEAETCQLGHSGAKKLGSLASATPQGPWLPSPLYKGCRARLQPTRTLHTASPLWRMPGGHCYRCGAG